MITTLLVALFALGVVLLMMGANSLALHRSRVPREFQGSAGHKSVWLILSGAACVVTSIVLFIARAASSS